MDAKKRVTEIGNDDALMEKKNTTADVEVSVHVLIRIKSEDGQTIRAHRNIVTSKGSAFLGKIGQALGAPLIKSLNTQIERGVTTFLFLTTREGWNGPYVTYQCRLKRVEVELDEKQFDRVPSYYEADYKNVKTWFEILSIDKMPTYEMNQIYVLSSGRPIMSVIKSSATTFRVGFREKPSGSV